ncbi:MAG: NAD-dependent epimerase/dehydratase family protein [Nanoarchaeota archaeon]
MYLVTGCAGFIGSHLTEKLLEQGHRVIGVDCFTDYYSKDLKEKNIKKFINHKNFTFIRKSIEDITSDDLVFNNLKDIEAIFHLAAQAGVRASWGDDFRHYTIHTFEATQKMLEVARKLNVKKFVFASSSSVYGDVEIFPILENSGELNPKSPYGVTKLASEKLCHLYHKTFGLPIICLRYFTVYGPRQRPDMGFTKFITAIETNNSINVYGDGTQTRDFTYVSDVVDATISAANCKSNFAIINIAGGSRVDLNSVIATLRTISGKQFEVKNIQNQLGDVKHTHASIDLAKSLLNYNPKVKLEEGLANQYKWYKDEFLRI